MRPLESACTVGQARLARVGKQSGEGGVRAGRLGDAAAAVHRTDAPRQAHQHHPRGSVWGPAGQRVRCCPRSASRLQPAPPCSSTPVRRAGPRHPPHPTRVTLLFHPSRAGPLSLAPHGRQRVPGHDGGGRQHRGDHPWGYRLLPEQASAGPGMSGAAGTLSAPSSGEASARWRGDPRCPLAATGLPSSHTRTAHRPPAHTCPRLWR